MRNAKLGTRNVMIGEKSGNRRFFGNIRLGSVSMWSWVNRVAPSAAVLRPETQPRIGLRPVSGAAKPPGAQQDRRTRPRNGPGTVTNLSVVPPRSPLTARGHSFKEFEMKRII